MSALPRFFGLALLVSFMLGLSTWILLPESFALWRKGIMVCLSASLGFRLAMAIRATQQGKVTAWQTWLECPSFLWVMAAFYHLPSLLGWLFLAMGWAWRFLVKNLWK